MTARSARMCMRLRGLRSGCSKKRIKKRSRVGPRWDRGRSAGRSAGAGVFGVGIGIVLLIICPLSVRSI